MTIFDVGQEVTVSPDDHLKRDVSGVEVPVESVVLAQTVLVGETLAGCWAWDRKRRN